MSDVDYAGATPVAWPTQLRDLRDERDAALTACAQLRIRVQVLEDERADANGDRLQALAERFGGVDVKYRREWRQWTARNITSKNERDSYRITREGRTAAAAIANLLDAIDLVDALVLARSKRA